MSIPTEQDQQEAKEALAFIRRTMESASTFTAVSGWGLIASGIVALVAAWLAWMRANPAELQIWIPAAAVSVVIATSANAIKARGSNTPLWSGVMQRIVWVMAPSLIAGALLTFALEGQGASQLLPGMWLALYGAGVTAGGTLSIRAIRWMGIAFLVLGATALARPDLGLAMLAVGFGGLHVTVGSDIVWRHGG
ncbi:MAG: hypothetical protein JSW71_02670 [Gemmatimonadota bacterium]|nr:MAG: hypothetical protein JSW71_02670 [Gemmatimonadota bacterium]